MVWMSPRDFVLAQEATHLKPYSVYTVLPSLPSGLLDLPFHIRRLHDSLDLLKAFEIGEFQHWTLEDTREGVVGLLSEMDPHALPPPALLTITAGVSQTEGSIAFQGQLSPKSLSQPAEGRCVVFSEGLQRGQVGSKYSAWLRERAPAERLKALHPLAVEVVMTRRGLLTEGLVSNVALLTDGGLRCPRPCHCLPGSALQLLRELCLVLRLPLSFEDICVKEYEQWRGLWLLSAGKGAQAVPLLLPPSSSSPFSLPPLQNQQLQRDLALLKQCMDRIYSGEQSQSNKGGEEERVEETLLLLEGQRGRPLWTSWTDIQLKKNIS